MGHTIIGCELHALVTGALEASQHDVQAPGDELTLGGPESLI